ncbi:transporter substrate-binding domain-containing protein [Cylindrospermum sp. FACHB-282]|uniref:transporter substrate-binding domain-containing protein n=1 Tax=Cylindrospermum sp. FACHB-282 TaxID=2692794 RepID=UPI00168875C8|nr:transporter substrate-binding domain-containing protein [Cylindrospermum sp. FACHB-282]MBD2385369.1 transporter substrate-binding domain-containing protein [Cylindrospermum sp. FACHB-282]
MVNAIASKFRQVMAKWNRFITYFFRHHSKNKNSHSLIPHICLGLGAGLLVLLLVGHPVLAQTPQPTQPLLVATRAIPPFVFDQKGELSGFSIDLWRSITKQLGLQSKFIEYPTVVDLLSAVKNGTANLGISAISITAERQQNFDFSLPMFAAGLQILVRNPEANSGGVPNILQIFFSAAFLQLIVVALVLIVISAHIIWWFERRHEDGMIAKEYFPGIFKAYWWAAATLATQADEMPKGPLGRLIAIIWMFIGVLFVTYFTAIATTSLTVQQLQGDIKSISDLPGKIVATTSGSTAAIYLRENKISVLEVPKIEQAYNALLQKKADAVVFDAPVILFYAANEGKGKVEVVGSIFREESYGIVLPNNSPYRKQINSALLSLRENGTYQTLYEKWFKSKES